MSQYRNVPTFTVGIVEGVKTTADFYRYLQAHDQGQPPSSEVTVTVSASPFTYTAPRGGFILVQGGTVSAIAFSRSATTAGVSIFYTTGQTMGVFPVSQNDKLKVTYSGKPSMIFISQ